MSFHLAIGYGLAVWGAVLILAELVSQAAPIKRSAPVFWYVFAIWLLFNWISLPR